LAILDFLFADEEHDPFHRDGMKTIIGICKALNNSECSRKTHEDILLYV